MGAEAGATTITLLLLFLQLLLLLLFVLLRSSKIVDGEICSYPIGLYFSIVYYIP